MAVAVARAGAVAVRSANVCPGCGPVAGPRSRYCRVHVAELWRQVWAHRPIEPEAVVEPAS